MSSKLMDITKIIKNHITDYTKKYNNIELHNGIIMKCSSPYDINNGLCDNFTCDILESMKHSENNIVFELSTDMFMTYDIEFAEKEWEQIIIKDEIAWSKEMLNLYGSPKKLIYIPYHIWICQNEKHYDAECPNGTNKWFNLPIFRHYFANSN